MSKQLLVSGMSHIVLPALKYHICGTELPKHCLRLSWLCKPHGAHVLSRCTSISIGTLCHIQLGDGTMTAGSMAAARQAGGRSESRTNVLISLGSTEADTRGCASLLGLVARKKPEWMQMPSWCPGQQGINSFSCLLSCS